MDLFARLTRLPRAPFGGAMAGAGFALLFLLLPAAALEELVLASGLPALFAAAEPPLGLTARLALALLGGAGFGALVWLALFVVFGQSNDMGATAIDLPVLRKADAHPDAPARRPIFAGRDLGTPFLEIRADERAPLLELASEAEVAQVAIAKERAEAVAPVTSAAIPAAPLSPPAPPPIFCGEPVIEPAPVAPRADPPISTPVWDEEPITAPETAATIHALLDRLERGVGRRDPVIRSVPLPTPTAAGGEEAALREALGSLRRLATRAV